MASCRASRSTLEKEAEAAMSKGLYSDATEKYTQLIEACPDQTGKWLAMRGECHLSTGCYAEALQDGKEAVRKSPGDVRASVVSGKAAFKLGMFTDALTFFKTGLAQDPNNSVITQELKAMQKAILKEQKEVSDQANCSYSPLSLCNQAIYPGDDKLLVMEKEILEIKYKILDDVFYKNSHAAENKDADQEVKLVQAAYECLRAEDLPQALILITQAVQMDPTNIFYRSFRAQVHFNMGNWTKVLQDYWVIPKAQRKPDVWKQGGKALVELWLPVLAEFWLRKATQLSGGKDEEAAMLFQKVRVKRLYDPLTEDQPVHVEFTQFGRAVIAKDDIAQGETVMTDIPMVMAQSLASRHIPACFNCAASLITPDIYFGKRLTGFDKDQRSLIEEYWPSVAVTPCPHCQMEFYCSKTCRLEAWDNYHRMICPQENPKGHLLYDLIKNDGYGYTSDGQWKEIWGGHYSPMILAKIWAIIASQVRSQMDAERSTAPTLEHWARAKAPFRRFIAYGTVQATTRMPYMLPVFQEIFAVCGGGICYEITPEEFNGRYYQAACNLQCFSPSITPYHRFLNSIKDDMRSVGLIKHLTDRPPEAQFAAMCPLHACSNHSCYNNAEVDLHFSLELRHFDFSYEYMRHQYMRAG
ncbi:SET and MYND domain-containing protein 5 [Plakobranchus ocellatus]|uniref:SET and MYND domain-containing protein 5 n=1 Tax=Plakobranchus ocellatus TaxID=259542 RepID=A0AAV3YAY0_9GAST|nr:SET and MYND domain-containing protein 5 [Plakobranchus ocellatus]